MAKSTPSLPETPVTDPVAGSLVDIHKLAAELFARNYIPRNSNVQAWKVAADCYVAAQDFVRVAAIAEAGGDLTVPLQ